jgi:hypothetical protein
MKLPAKPAIKLSSPSTMPAVGQATTTTNAASTARIAKANVTEIAQKCKNLYFSFLRLNNINLKRV